MSPTYLYAFVAGAALMLALWQPAEFEEAASAPAPNDRPANAVDKGSQKISEQLARHKAKWQQRKMQRGPAQSPAEP